MAMNIYGLIVLVLLLTTGCSQSAAFESIADGPCTSAQSKEVAKHLSGQIDAFAAKDWEAAYSYASSSFKADVPLDQFTQLIRLQYQMLVSNNGYSFNKCTIVAEIVTQEVRVNSPVGNYILNYNLSVEASQLGVKSAIASSLVSDLDL